MVVIIDDNGPEILRLIAKHLAEEGIESVQFVTAEKGRDSFENADLVIVNLGLAERGNAIRVIEYAREGGYRFPIAVTSGTFPFEADRLQGEARRLGVAACIAKPFPPDFVERIKALLR